MESNQKIIQQKSPITSLNQMSSEPYYLFHFLVFFSYISVRCSASQSFSPNFASHLLHRELQALLAFLVLVVVKDSWAKQSSPTNLKDQPSNWMEKNHAVVKDQPSNWMEKKHAVVKEVVREETWEAFISDSIFFAKIFLVGIALVLDRRLAIWYLLAFLVIYITAQQPAYPGLGTSNHLTPLQLESLLTEGNTSRFWLVEFHTLSSSACIRTSRLFPELSITYSNKNLSFGIVDLGLFSNTAEKFGISLGIDGTLPTYILFDNAAEVARFPEVDFEGKVGNPSITKKQLWQYFELDRILIDYINEK